jgi:hypothetical protein
MATGSRKIGICLLVISTVSLMATQAQAQYRGDAQRPEVRGAIKNIDATAGTMTILIGSGREQPPVEKTYTLAKDVEVAVGNAFGRGGGGYFKEAKVADLAEGILVGLTLTADEKLVESIVAEAPTVRGQLKHVDAGKNTLTITQPPGRDQATEDKTYTLAPDAEIAVDDGRGKRFSIREAKLADLSLGALVTVRLTLNQQHAQTVFAEGPSVFGIIKAVDPAKKTLTVTQRSPRGDSAGEETTLTLSNDSVVMLDDGKGRRLSLKEVKLADLPVGAAITAKLGQDQAHVMSLRAEGAALNGLLRAVDPSKELVTIAVPRGRGEEPEAKTFPVAKDARIVIAGSFIKLADLKVVDNGPYVQLRLSLDQKTVQTIMAHQGGR